jgi:hypothetical protein
VVRSRGWGGEVVLVGGGKVVLGGEGWGGDQGYNQRSPLTTPQTQGKSVAHAENNILDEKRKKIYCTSNL